MSPKIKICGVCDPLEARRIEELGADYVGMIFYSRSPRFVDIGKAKKIADAMSGKAKRVEKSVGKGYLYFCRSRCDHGFLLPFCCGFDGSG